LKTLAAFTTPEEAHNLRAFLESGAIAAYVRDEYISASYSNAVGGVKVDVDEADFERALALYTAVQNPTKQDFP
jgi:hypothetical protein